MLSEIPDYVGGRVDVATVFSVLRPLAFSLGIRLEPSGADYRAIRLPPARPLELDEKERSAQAGFLASPRVPDGLERLIEQYVEKKTGKAWDDPAVVERLRRAIAGQKAEYWREGRKRRVAYETGYSVLGYLAYQFPVYFAQTEHILYELATGGLLKDRMQVLDAGTGPGTVPLAIIDFFRRIGRGDAVVHSIEKYAENAEAFDYIVPAFAEGTGVRVEKPAMADLSRPLPDGVPDGVDLIFLSNVLNELEGDVERKAEAVLALAGRLARDGSLVISEPADRSNSTAMRELVVALMGKGLGVYSPCSFIWGVRCHPESCWTFQQKPDVEPTRLMRKAAETEPFRFLNTDLKYSYAILRHDRLSREKYRVPEKAKFARLSRLGSHVGKHINVVAAVMSADLGNAKDHVFKICDGTAAKPVYAVLPDFHVTPKNAALLAAGYGQVVEAYGVLARYNGEYDAYNLLVTRNTAVRQARP